MSRTKIQLVMLPTFEDIRSKVVKGKPLDPLEQYIYNNEPASVEQCAEFRITLETVIQHVLNMQCAEPPLTPPMQPMPPPPSPPRVVCRWRSSSVVVGITTIKGFSPACNQYTLIPTYDAPKQCPCCGLPVSLP